MAGDANEGLAASVPPYEPPERGLLYGLIVVVSLLAAAVAGWIWWQASEQVDIAIDGITIANADVVIKEADSLYQQVMEADGATLTDDERCFFAGRGGLPQVVCGPGWLGVSLAEQPWLEMSVDYELGDNSYTGTVSGVTGPTDAEMRTFNRPDGRKAVSPGEPIYPTAGPRTTVGSLVTDPAAAVSAADAAFTEAMRQPNPLELSVHPDARCFLVESIGDRSETVLRDQAFCGPMRTFDSGSDELWARVRLRWITGEIFGASTLEAAEPLYTSTDDDFWLSALPEGSALTRPDGLGAAPAKSVDRPPRRGDFAEAVPAGVGETVAGFGRLVNEFDTITFTGFGRTDRLGTGPDAVIAAPGYELVVARHVALEANQFQPRGLLLVDGAQVALPARWWVLNESQLLVVSVPTGTSSVALMIENEGRPQTISLDDGGLEPGFPLALYREPVELNKTIATRVEMPAGEAVLIEGLVVGLDWSAKTLDAEWLPVGQSRLDLDFQSFLFDYPCCEVSGIDITTSVTLIDPASGNELPDERPDPGTGPPSFLVNEGIEAVTLRFDFVVSFDVEGEAQQELARIDLEVALP